MKKQQSIFKTIVFAVVLFVAGLMAYQHLTKPLAEEAKASNEWPTTSGIITSSQMTKKWKKDEQQLNKGEYMYSANVSYNYSVDGKEYESNRIESVHSSTSSSDSVKETLQKYAKGNTVTVYYNPESPNTTMLEPGISFGLSLLFKLPLVFCTVSVIIFLGLLKRLLFR